MTPLQIRILLHYYTNPQTDYASTVSPSHCNSEGFHNAFRVFNREGILRRVPGGPIGRTLANTAARWEITAKGSAAVDQLKAAAPSVPHGIQKFDTAQRKTPGKFRTFVETTLKDMASGYGSLNFDRVGVVTPKGRITFPELTKPGVVTPLSSATDLPSHTIAKRLRWSEKTIEAMPFDYYGFEVFMNLREGLIAEKVVTPARWRACFDIVMGRTRNLKNQPLAMAIYFKMEEANNGRELRRAALDTLSTTWSPLAPGD